ncbi:CYTH-like domain-containing protein [Sordaria brevicollis]|uniref:Thiamine-triphosphatase n=1 Tax=Sordaria brevicollis TaxID=83679 RepID=A0AAE0P2J6_SORBR|nr:CYTH-like domain-containing protein [Sordaria brevicollis]
MPIRQTLPKAFAPCILEVERKFRSLAVRQLTQHGGVPPFRSLQALRPQTIRDTYYNDKAGLLTSAGVWVRRRNGAWEAKVRKGGDFTNSQFEELREVGDIAACVERITGQGVVRAGEQVGERGQKENFGLVTMADFVTTRETWIADDEFWIVRDRMDFGHEVGEVELQKTLEGKKVGEAPSEEEKRAEMQRMDERITEFMKRYEWAFAEGKPVGKLTAYFKMMGRTPSGSSEAR